MTIELRLKDDNGDRRFYREDGEPLRVCDMKPGDVFEVCSSRHPCLMLHTGALVDIADTLDLCSTEDESIPDMMVTKYLGRIHSILLDAPGVQDDHKFLTLKRMLDLDYEEKRDSLAEENEMLKGLLQQRKDTVEGVEK